MLPLLLSAAAGLLVTAGVAAADAAFVRRARIRSRARKKRRRYVAMLVLPVAAAGLGFFLPQYPILPFLTGLGTAVTVAAFNLGSLDGALARLVVRRYERQLADPRRREAALDKLRRRLAREYPSNHAYARALIHSVHILTRGFRWRIVLDVIEHAELGRLNREGQRLLCVYGALAHLHLGSLAEARKWLDAVDGPIDVRYRPWRLALDAVVAASEGQPSRARKILEGLDDSYPLEREVALAHVLAAEGQTAEARQVLVRVQTEHDDTALESVELLPGPASALKAAVLSGSDSPYR